MSDDQLLDEFKKHLLSRHLKTSTRKRWYSCVNSTEESIHSLCVECNSDALFPRKEIDMVCLRCLNPQSLLYSMKIHYIDYHSHHSSSPQ